MAGPPGRRMQYVSYRLAVTSPLIPVRRRGAVLKWIPSGHLTWFDTANGSPHRERTTFDTPDPSPSPVGGLNSERECNTHIAAVDLGHTIRRADPPTGCHFPRGWVT